MNHLNLRLAEGIRRVGFRKWYERELLSSHAYLLLALLSATALMASVEVFRGGSISEKLIDVCIFIASGGSALWALRRYLFLLLHAEELANQASCSNCETYGRLTLVHEDRRNGHAIVHCKQCAHEWTMTP